ncbi:Type IV secretory pathway, VirJ component [Solimonas aquatica]|uniref:Type IV secretory pathway, VirJ component n=1 Tax=Solimonas aquatica TaxID=489703 RepID=A0A1H9MCY6_9GAMM|nr:AcvB/VirJ family lysyl-phosphatidylglycerol hydrolase [Solimonas aquatica]SER21315.1 Type IV secretory pathway, VirJ component [Solimonas aquatica]
MRVLSGWRLMAAMLLPLLCGVAQAEQTLSHGRFETVTLYPPKGQVKSFVMAFSGAGGWQAHDAYIAKLLAGEGALVAGIDLREFYREMSKDPGDCYYASGDLENLSRYVQAYYRLPTYYPPILVGEGLGANLAYAMNAQGEADQWTGTISLGFCPQTGLRKPFCAGKGVRYPGKIKPKNKNLLSLAPAAALHAPWTWIDPEGAEACEAPASFADNEQAQRLSAAAADRDRLLLQRYRLLVAKLEPEEPALPGSLSDLPLIELKPVKDQSEDFAVLLSGDGGWADLDKRVATVLQARGIPVVGVDSLRYFWNERTPTSVAGDLDRIVRYYMTRWHKQRVLLIGYSQGANVLPFALNRLPSATRGKVAVTVLMGLGERADFEFHVSNWVSESDSGLPIAPEMQRIVEGNPVCIYGVKEDDSLCPKLDAKKIHLIQLPGAHHFDGNYEHLADLIIAAAARQP